ncbi:MAG: dihydroneopterin aldolase [Candidatus Abyssobacteria bacterium SURF_17]|uniref:7,8-dihydroneopterin aldolase n=1 Tax=Candidatus Abyssobacteria bacterium SURF_17 TaxID=2093361 RepID=A0A419F7H8_9BACT|nr:MAG: dihydroneopterin aldolase [Candidatus Abyssubacteria bacterium SURF_17]
MQNNERITLKNMLLAGSIGVADWERKVPTRIEVDLELYADLKEACKSDDLNDTIDYAKAYELVNQVIKARHHNLIESVAEEVASAVLKLCDCQKVVVRVRKPHPPLSGMCDYAEVEIARHRGNRR